MKRLLAYLFIILGLGLVLNTSCIAQEKYACSNLEVKPDVKYLECLQKELRTLERLVYSKALSKGISEAETNYVNNSIDSMDNAVKKLSSQLKNSNFKEKKFINIIIKDLKTLKRGAFAAEINTNENKKNKTKEPSQNFDRELFFTKLTNFEEDIKELTNRKEEFEYKKLNTTNFSFNSCNNLKNKIKIDIDRIENEINYFKKTPIPDNFVRSALKFNDLKINFDNLKKGFDCENTQISKAEPSQTQKKEIKSNIYFCDNRGDYFISKKSCKAVQGPTGGPVTVSRISENEYIAAALDYKENDKFFKVRLANLRSQYQAWGLDISPIENFINSLDKKTQIAKAEPSQNEDNLLYCTHSYVKSHERIKNFVGLSKSPGLYFQIKKNCSKYFFAVSKTKYLELLTAYEKNVLEKLTTTPKKKVKVAKVEEPKQEEFKPENRDIDNDAPVIEIAQNIIVDSQTYTLKGKVNDKSKLYLEANGRPLKISKRGNFELEGFVVDPDAGDKIKIVAIDQWQNKSEKTINIKVEFKEIAELRSYEKPNPSKIKVKQDKNKIAIIIGIEKYKTLKNIDAPYANRDANAFRAYANRALGIPNKNIKVLIDENATRGETLKALTLWLPQIARGKNKDIYVFFAGHGLASDDGKNLYILPQDGDADLLQYTALSRLEIFDLINRVEPNSVTMFFDTCYSGQTRDERMLVAGLRPIRLVAEEQEVQNNFTIFTASNYDQTSGSIEEAKHGIFSYYLMMGMQGKADSNQDKKITNGELIAYLKQNVSEEAFINNRQQEPMLSGDPDKVLISYR